MNTEERLIALVEDALQKAQQSGLSVSGDAARAIACIESGDYHEAAEALDTIDQVLNSVERKS